MTEDESNIADTQADPVSVTIVDACLRDGYGGSPTAVLWEKGLSDADRRRVPQLAGTSHAVFVSDRLNQLGESEVSLRFFTTGGELPACGHGTVAALAFLAENSGRADYRVSLRTPGRGFVGRAIRTGAQVNAEFDPGPVQLRQATPDECGLAVETLKDHPEIRASQVFIASVGRPRLLVPISTASAVAALTPDLALLREGCDRLGLLGCYVYSLPTADGRITARMFAPSIGVPEDIANANSTACLAARLAQQESSRIAVDMGDSLGHPATITATTHTAGSATEVRVGGAAAIDRTIQLRA